MFQVTMYCIQLCSRQIRSGNERQSRIPGLNSGTNFELIPVCQSASSWLLRIYDANKFLLSGLAENLSGYLIFICFVSRLLCNHVSIDVVTT